MCPCVGVGVSIFGSGCVNKCAGSAELILDTQSEGGTSEPDLLLDRTSVFWV